jgi:AcrR family transcriptional regulator
MTAVGSTRPGGRTARTAAAVFAAALEELINRPYGEITVETVAARAGVHKTTVYRRWGSSAEVISRALEQAAATEVPPPDTGSLAGDLAALAASVAEVIGSPAGGAVLRALTAGGPANPELRSIAGQFWRQRRLAIGTVVGRAVDRGELPSGTDAELLMRSTVAPLYFAVLVDGTTPDERAVRTSVDAALAATAAGVFDGDVS